MTLTRFWALACAAGLCLAAVGKARATVFIDDEFDYTNGDLTSVSSAAWAAHSGAGSSPIQVTDGAAILVQPSVEDVNRLANSSLAPGSTWYYGARLKVTDTRPTPGTGAFDDGYFIHFKEDGTVNFRGRGFITAGTDPAKFTFGVTSSSSAPTAAAAKWATDLDFGTEYTIMVAYTADDDDTNVSLVRDGFADLWVNPVSAASTFVTDSNPNANVSTDLSDPMIALALRQSQAPAGPASVAVTSVAAGDDFAQVLTALAPPAVNNSDFDNDGDVDGDDFLAWQQGLGQTGLAPGNKSTGDADGDGDVDGTDLGIWTAHYGLPPSVAAAGAVPEPGALALAACAMLGLALRRRRA